MKALPIYLAVVVLWAASLTAEEVKERLTQDFREQFDPSQFELVGGDAPTRYCRPGKDGVLLSIPAADERVSFCGLQLRSVVRGDFEITASYRILNLPRVAKGHGAGLKISIKDAAQEAASLQRIRTKGGQIYSAHRAVVKADGGLDHSSETRPTRAMSGKLRLVRTGPTLRYLVQEGEADEFTELRRVEFGDRDVVQTYFAAQTGGSGTEVEVALTGIEVAAAELRPLHERKTSTASRWPIIAFLALAVGGTAAALFVAKARRSRSA
ncbi:MAG TPA: DUF1583 domain-containing protein [Pirellulales bacterium]|nr:DUF1583 domain-containing protein [Pirellulales bacterium]